MSDGMRSVSVRLPAEVDEMLTEVARRRRTSRSAVVRDALEALSRSGPKTVAALAGDLVGCVEGPGDLSTNPKYMDDFGT